MTTHRHLFIAIDGLKCSGKTSVSRLLAASLDAVWYATPPPLFRKIRDSIERAADPAARQLYYLAGLVQAAAEIRELLADRPVVCDKFIASALVYSLALDLGTAMPFSLVSGRPDYTFVLDVPDALRRDRMARRGPITAEQDAFFHREVELQLARRFSLLDVILEDGASADAGTVATRIRDRIVSSQYR